MAVILAVGGLLLLAVGGLAQITVNHLHPPPLPPPEPRPMSMTAGPHRLNAVTIFMDAEIVLPFLAAALCCWLAAVACLVGEGARRLLRLLAPGAS